MCTAVAVSVDDFYFGRTLDYESSYNHAITITPRNFPLPFRNRSNMHHHYAILGVAYTPDDYPLYYDAINEYGLGMAGLNFPGNARFSKITLDRDNVATFEFIPYILSQCKTVKEAVSHIKKINLTNVSYSKNIPPSPLHWIIADNREAITVESTKYGVNIYENPVGVLTNNPPFPEQIRNLTNYLHLSPGLPKNTFVPETKLIPYSRGMGAMGMPGDLSSQSRFVRAVFAKTHSHWDNDELSRVGQFFHIMETVSQTKGLCEVEKNDFEITIYTSCANASRGIYYYTTYTNRRMNAIDMNKENLDGSNIIIYPIDSCEDIKWNN